jgi:DNA polymerase-3 subunit delta'
VRQLQHPDLHFSFPTIQAISKTADGNLKEWREQISDQPYFDLNGWIRKTDVRERKPIIGVQESEGIIKKLSLRSYEGGYKVMIIWMADQMNVATANKLLKILEEPPKNTVFILCAESQESMLATILSRCQIVNIPRISIVDLSLYFRENKQMNSNQADSVASRVEGDFLEALEYMGDHQEQDANRDQFIQLMRVCYRKNVLEMMQWSEDIATSSRAQQKIFLKYALHMFRQSMLRNYTEDHLTRVSEEEDHFLEKFARFISGNNVFDFMTSFNDAHYHIDRNANPKILFMNLCFNVMRYIHAA